MSISIVIPAYNAGKFLAETIDSVLAQTETDWELVIVDDGSVDDTAAIATAYAGQDSRIRVITQPNGGVATARNTGLKASSGDFVMLLDHDDLLQPDALNVLRSALAGNSRATGVHGLAQKLGEQGAEGIQNFERRKLVDGKVVNADRKEPTTAAMVVFDNLIPTPGVALLRRSTIDALSANGDLFDQSAAPLDDWDFWLRVTQLGDILFFDEVVLRWRRHEAAGSTNIAAMSAAERRIRQRLIKQDLPPELAEVANYRYRKLLVTSKRRAARDEWKSARSSFRSGKVGAGLSAWSRGVGEYVGYLRSR